MKKFIIFTFLCALLSLASVDKSEAIPAQPHPVTVRQSDGSYITLKIFGDENFHYMTDMSGYIVAESAGTYYYASYTVNGELVISEKKVSAGTVGISRQIPEFIRLNTNNIEIEGLKTNFPTTGKIKSIVILADFTDKKFSIPSPADYFSRMLNERGFSENGATGSAFDYYYENSSQLFEPEFVVVGPVQLPNPSSFYGANDNYGNDSNPRQMIIDACKIASEEHGVNLGDYDMDGDGILDNVFVYYAGYNEAEGGNEETVWPHRSFIEPGTYVNGVELRSYACSSELRGNFGQKKANIGPFCHEFGHVLGLPDFYDTDGQTEGYSDGIYNWSLMCSGSYNNESRTPPYLNSVERNIAGWLEYDYVTDNGSYMLDPISSNKAYIIKSETEDEFFVLENRQQEGWDSHLEGHGMLIYHVDMSNSASGSYTARMRWQTNKVNSNSAHECMKIMMSSKVGEQRSAMTLPGSMNNTVFSAESNPANRFWNGKHSSISISDIKENAGIISFTAEGEKDITLNGTISDRTGKPVGGVTVSLSQTQTTAFKNNISLLAKAGEELSTTSDDQGNFSINLSDAGPGIYMISAEKEGYGSYSANTVIAKGNNSLDITMLKDEEKEYIEISHHDGSFNNAIGANGNAFETAALWDYSEDLKEYTGYKLKQVSFFVKDAAETELTIYIGDSKFSYKVNTIAGTTNYVDLTDRGISLPPDKDLMIGIRYSNYKVGTYPAALDAAAPVPGKGNLVRFDKGDWKSLSDEGVSGNFIISAYLSEAEIVPVESIQIEPASTDIMVGQTKTLKATVLPEDATDKSLKWLTSDESVVTVDEKGNITATGEGKVTITATSADGKVKGDCQITSEFVQMVTGKCLNTSDEILKNISIIFTSEDGGKDFRCTTSEDGTYTLSDIAPGKYRISSESDGYVIQDSDATVKEGYNEIDITLLSEEESKTIDLCWHNGSPDNRMGGSGRATVIAMALDEKDIADYIGYQLTGVSFMLAGKVNEIFINIYEISEFADELMPKYQMKVEEYKINEMTKVDVSELSVTFKEGKRYKIGYQINGYDRNDYPIVLDNSPAVDMKGNMMMDLALYTWENILESKGIDGNWLITAHIAPRSTMKIDITTDKGGALIRWEDDGSKEYEVTWHDKTSPEQTSTEKTDKNELRISGLEIGATYSVTVQSSSGLSGTGEFTMLPVGDRFLTLNIAHRYEEGCELYPELLNLNSAPDLVVWTIDDETFNPEEGLKPKKGGHTIKAEITTGQKVEYLIHYIEIY